MRRDRRSTRSTADRALRALGALASVSAAGCGATAPPLDVGRVGASIAVLASGEVAVVNADQGSVSVLDPATLLPRATVDVGAEPHALVELAGGRGVLVTTYRGGEAVLVDPASWTVKAHAAICAGPYGVAEVPDGSSVVVACEWDAAVVRVDPATLATTVVATGLSRPRAVATIGADVWVADFTGGSVRRVEASGAVHVVSLVPAAAPYRPALTSMSGNLAAAVLPAFGRVQIAHELVNHTGDTSAEKVADDYGSVVDGNPKINPAVSALDPSGDESLGASDPPALYAQFDGGPRVFNGPSALAAFGARYLLVGHVSTNDVAVLDAEASTPDARVVGSFAVGAGPAGVAVDATGSHAYVDNAFDGSVSRLDLGSALAPWAPAYPAELTVVRPLPQPFSAEALAGRRLFHDATNPHVTPSAVVACSTCHPGGSDDGLVWFIHTDTIPLKRRRTPHLANAHSATPPYHWDGQFPTIADLARGTITNLMAGDALLVDTASVSAYIDEIVAPPVPPPGDAAAVSRGASIFAAKCATTCHSGPDFTDNQFHAVLEPMSLQPDDVFPTANTPALHGLFLRAPYFHDGRATDLRDLLTRADAAPMTAAAKLSAQDVDDLVAYLQSL
jgi:DNA-binding beta-propeller fold protein YncE